MKEVYIFGVLSIEPGIWDDVLKENEDALSVHYISAK